jgi:hypothetical protein
LHIRDFLQNFISFHAGRLIVHLGIIALRPGSVHLISGHRLELGKRGNMCAKIDNARRTNPEGKLVLSAFAAAILGCGMSARAVQIDTDSDIKVRWDNTFKYSLGLRVSSEDQTLVNQPGGFNFDAGDRNFKVGRLFSDRVDWLSEVDASKGDAGFRISAAAWYDFRYRQSTDNGEPPVLSGLGSPHQFPNETVNLNGQKIDLLDAFAYDKGQIGDHPASVRLGRHTLLWGESLLIPSNGIAYGQAPLDLIKLLSVPNTQAKELFLPVTQASGQIQFGDVSLAAYVQVEWRRTRIPGVGSYFSFANFLDAGGHTLIIQPPSGGAPGLYLDRADDQTPSNFSQGGLALRWRSKALDAEFGVYAVNYADKLPQIYVQPGVDVASTGAGVRVGKYGLVFPQNSQIYGASATKDIGDVSVGMEVSFRNHTPLNSSPPSTVALPNQSIDAGHTPGAIGRSFHAQANGIYLLPPCALWNGGQALGEVAYNQRISVRENSATLDRTNTVNAYGFRGIFDPSWFQVLPGLDIDVPVGLGYNPKGRSSVVQLFNGGGDKGGDVSIGLNGLYFQTWKFGVDYTRYIGSARPNPTINAFRDRDFISLFVQRTI